MLHSQGCDQTYIIRAYSLISDFSLCKIPQISVQERYEHTGPCPAKDCEDDSGTGVSDIQGESKAAVSIKAWAI